MVSFLVSVASMATSSSVKSARARQNSVSVHDTPRQAHVL